MKKVLLFLCLSVSFHTETQNLQEVLWNENRLLSSLSFSSFDEFIDSNPGPNFSISISNENKIKGFGFNILLDTYNIQKDFNLSSIPKFTIDLYSSDGSVSPSQKFIQSKQSFYNLYIGTGIHRLDNDNNYSVVILPIALLHKNANCVHNGVLVFSILENKISNSIFQVSSETCAYLKFDLVAVLEMNNTLSEMTNRNISNDTSRKTIAISNLYDQYNIKANSFADSANFNNKNVTIFGLVDGDNHYSSNCQTRAGQYPFCNELLLPSYSLAKSLAGTVTLALLQEQFSNIADISVSVIPECDTPSWNNVTLEDLSDMASGHFLRSTFDYDENSSIHGAFLFEALTHEKKIKIACKSFPRKTKPGKKFVYRTSDTYILGSALNEFIRNKNLGDDYFLDILTPLFNELELSDASKYTLRTFDEELQPYTGWGMYLTRDDLMKLSNFFHKVRNDEDNYSFLYDALNPSDFNSLVALKDYDIFYNNGFWSKKFNGKKLGCKNDIWVPFMSGFGGITFAFFPNGMSYYYFSDGYVYSWEDAVHAANVIKPFC